MSLSKVRLDELAAQPELIVGETLNDLYSLSRSDYQYLQLAALKTRFKQLRGRITALTKLADGIGAKPPADHDRVELAIQNRRDDGAGNDPRRRDAEHDFGIELARHLERESA